MRDLRKLLVQPLPPTSRALTHLKLGLLWAFAGAISGRKSPSCLFKLPCLRGPPHAEVLLHAVLHIPMKPSTLPCPACPSQGTAVSWAAGSRASTSGCLEEMSGRCAAAALPKGSPRSRQCLPGPPRVQMTTAKFRVRLVPMPRTELPVVRGDHAPQT